MVLIPCKVCSTLIPYSSRRFGASCCNSCAAFFSRSISKEYSYECDDSKACLKIPSKIGTGCRRCRYDKCIEIGMTTNGMNKSSLISSSSSSPSSSSSSSSPLPPAPTEPASPEPKDTILDQYTEMARILESILTFSMAFPTLVEAYLAEGKQDLITFGFKNLEGVPVKPMSDRITFLMYLFTKFLIHWDEFPVFIWLSICKLEMKGIPEDQKTKIKLLQNISLATIGNFNVTGNRLAELATLSQHFLNTFYIFC